MTSSPSPRPLSITVIAVVLAVGAILSCFNLQPPTPVLGFVITGFPAMLHNLFLAAIGLIAGIGLWRLREIARRVAIGLLCYLVLSAVLFVFNPFGEWSLWGMQSKLDAAFSKLPDFAELPRSNVFTALHGALTGIAMTVIPLSVMLWFLITRKAAFGKPGTMPAQGEITVQPRKEGRIVIRLAGIALLLRSFSRFISMAQFTGLDPTAMQAFSLFGRFRMLVELGCDAGFIVAAIGLLLVSSWSRILLIGALGLEIAFGLLEAAFAVAGVEGAYLGPIGLLISLGVRVGLIVMLTRPAVKAQFQKGGGSAASRKGERADHFSKRNLAIIGGVLGVVAVSLGLWSHRHRGAGQDTSPVVFIPEPQAPKISVPRGEPRAGYGIQPARDQQVGVGQDETDWIVAAVQSVTPDTIELEQVIVIPESVIVHGEAHGTDRDELQKRVSTYVSALKRLPGLAEAVVYRLQTRKEEGVTVLHFVIEGQRAGQRLADARSVSKLKETREDRAEVVSVEAVQAEAAVRSAAPASIDLKQISVDGQMMRIEGEVPGSGGNEMLTISAYVKAIKALPGLSDVSIKSVRRSMREGTEVVSFELAARLEANRASRQIE